MVLFHYLFTQLLMDNAFLLSIDKVNKVFRLGHIIAVGLCNYSSILWQPVLK